MSQTAFFTESLVRGYDHGHVDVLYSKYLTVSMQDPRLKSCYGVCYKCLSTELLNSKMECCYCEVDFSKKTCFQCLCEYYEVVQDVDRDTFGYCPDCRSLQVSCTTCGTLMLRDFYERTGSVECDSCSEASSMLLEGERYRFNAPMRPPKKVNTHYKPAESRRGKARSSCCPFCRKNHSRKSDLHGLDLCAPCNNRLMHRW